MNIPALIQVVVSILPEEMTAQTSMMPMSTSSETTGDAVSVNMNRSMAIPMLNSHQPEKPSLYITKMKPR